MNKKPGIIFSIACIILAAFFPLQASATNDGPEPAEPRNAIGIDVFSPISAVINYILLPEAWFLPMDVQYQRVISEHWVLFARMQLWLYPVDPGSFIVTPAVEMDWHPFHKGLNGFYTGLSTALFHGSLTGSTAIGLGYLQHTYGLLELVAGWQFLLPCRLDINLGTGLVGVGYLYRVDYDGGIKTEPFVSPPIMTPRLSLAVGYAF